MSKIKFWFESNLSLKTKNRFEARKPTYKKMARVSFQSTMSTAISRKTHLVQIGILVPIEPQRRTNGTSGTGSSIKHLKAVPFKTKKAPKCGNFHRPMWTYLIRTIDYILAPTKHLENFITIVFLRGNNESNLINRDVNRVSQIAQWAAGWHSASIVYS